MSAWLASLLRFLRLVVNPWTRVYTVVSALIGIAGLLGFAALIGFLPTLEPYRWQMVAGVVLLFVFAAGFRLQREKDQAGALPRLDIEGRTSGKKYALIDVTNTRSLARTFTAQLLKAGDSTRRRSLSWGVGGSRPEKVEILPQLTNQVVIGQVSEKSPRSPERQFRIRIMRPKKVGGDYFLVMPEGLIEVTVRISASDGEVNDVVLEIRTIPTGVDTTVKDQLPVA